MRKDIHPEYSETTIACACGTIIKVMSTGKNMHVNTCAACHPFFTGKAAILDARGRVEQFRKRYAKK
jgi:large subunit ribosomal protein L31